VSLLPVYQSLQNIHSFFKNCIAIIDDVFNWRRDFYIRNNTDSNKFTAIRILIAFCADSAGYLSIKKLKSGRKKKL